MDILSTCDNFAENACQAYPSDDLVTLVDGTALYLEGMERDDLLALQWEQEHAFARKILNTTKDSLERARITCQAYDTVTRIFAAANSQSDGPLLMGFHSRIERLVLKLLLRQEGRGLDVRFFEIGYGAGKLLQGIRNAGFPFAGIEISSAMHKQAVNLIGENYRSQLHLGEFIRCEAAISHGPWSMVYWNDVFEHIHPDEIGDWLHRIYEILMPGGQLVTITPNWHVRPSDITRAFCPPRSEANGFHLKEYTLREICKLLTQAGFEHIAVPLAVTHRHAYLCGRGLIGWKCLLEPSLEWMPFRLANLLCRGLGLSCTIATKRKLSSR